MTDDDLKEGMENKRETADSREERECRRIEEQTDFVPDNDIDTDDHSNRANELESEGRTVNKKDKKLLDVPQITVDRGAKLDAAEQVEDLPTDNWSVQIPQFQVGRTSMIDADEMVDAVLAESKEEMMNVPQFASRATNRLIPAELDSNQSESLESVEQLQIPQITLNNDHRIKPFSTFVETVPELTAEGQNIAAAEVGVNESVEEEQEGGQATIQVNEDAVNALNDLRIGDEWAIGELPDPLELLFGSDGTAVKSVNPMVVLAADDSLVGIVETLIKRRYREIEAGEPELQKFDSANQLAHEERWISADSRIFTAQLPDEEWKKLERDHQERWRSIWRNRFEQLFSGQRFGAIIFNRTEIPEPGVTSLPHHLPVVVDLNRGVYWKDIARVFWTDIDAVEPLRAQTFSQVFDPDTSGIAQDTWIQILQATDGQFNLATDGDDGESDEHYALKVFVVKWLAKQLWQAEAAFTTYDDFAEIDDYREIERRIPTEQPLRVGDDNPIRPDVRYESQVFEVEMFFGEADKSGIMTKLQKTVRKYEDVERNIEIINIIVDNLTCFLHLKELAQFKRNHLAWEDDHAEINLHTVDLGQNELIPVSEIVSEIASLSPS